MNNGMADQNGSKDAVVQLRFRRLGGAYQQILENADDLKNVLNLNIAHWAITSIQTNSLICDPVFLAALDSDGNGRIRADEVREALAWMLDFYRDLSDVVKGADYLTVHALNPENPKAATLLENIRIMMQNLGIPDAAVIDEKQLSDHEKMVANALQNGDGIIPPDPVEDPDAAACIRDVMKRIGSHPDISGAQGISADDLNQYESQAKGYAAWLEQKQNQYDTLFAYGDNTHSFYQAYQTVAEQIRAYFQSCETLNYTESKQTVTQTYDPLNPASVAQFLDQSLIAEADKSCILQFNEKINPVWRSRVEKFFQSYGECGGNTVSITLAEWKTVESNLNRYGAWLNAKNTNAFDDADLAQIKTWFEQGVPDRIRSMMNMDLAVANNLKGCQEAKKLLLYQKNMMEFLNNFVSLHCLFDYRKKSMIQVGYLIMDGRRFTLCTLVNNIAEHKSIALKSNICVMYLNITSGKDAALKTMKLAVAVTSGHMRNLFVGKSGVFYTDDGVVWDAKVIDFIQQPVSISEALRSPFIKFADFMQKQADKFFAVKSKNYETSISKEVDKSAAMPIGNNNNGNAAPAAGPNIAGPMMVMGGGIGLAALGSAFAFIAKSLSNISFWVLISIILGILLIFGGPVVLSSMIKLFRRNLAVFFEANGYALNRQMRLSVKMGRVFTFEPSLPQLSILKNQLDYWNGNDLKKSCSKIWKKILWIGIGLIWLGLCLLFGYLVLYPWLAGKF